MTNKKTIFSWILDFLVMISLNIAYSYYHFISIYMEKAKYINK